MTDLRPPALEEYGLAPALRVYAKEFAERTGLKASVSAEGREVRLPTDIELALFRIAQEALTNAAKHSGGSRAHISLKEEEGRVRLSIEDDDIPDPLALLAFLAGVTERLVLGTGVLILPQRSPVVCASPRRATRGSFVMSGTHSGCCDCQTLPTRPVPGG